MCGLNVIVDESVTGEISISLRDIPLVQALDNLTSSRGDAYRLDGNLLVIATKEKMLASSQEVQNVQIFSFPNAKPQEVAGALGLVLGQGRFFRCQTAGSWLSGAARISCSWQSRSLPPWNTASCPNRFCESALRK